MIRDAALQVATNQRPELSQLTLGPIGITGQEFYPFPNGALAPTVGPQPIDLLTSRDIGDGYPLIARFKVVTTFTSADASTLVKFGACLSSDANFAGVDHVILCLGHPLSLAQLLANSFYELALPKVSTVHTGGRRYLHLGMVITTTIAATLPLFTAGGVDAGIVLDSQSEVRDPQYSGGFVGA